MLEGGVGASLIDPYTTEGISVHSVAVRVHCTHSDCASTPQYRDWRRNRLGLRGVRDHGQTRPTKLSTVPDPRQIRTKRPPTDCMRTLGTYNDVGGTRFVGCKVDGVGGEVAAAESLKSGFRCAIRVAPYGTGHRRFHQTITKRAPTRVEGDLGDLGEVATFPHRVSLCPVG